MKEKTKLEDTNKVMKLIRELKIDSNQLALNILLRTMTENDIDHLVSETDNFILKTNLTIKNKFKIGDIEK